MAKKCTDCYHCDDDWKDGRTWCGKYRCWVKLEEAERCRDFEPERSSSGPCYLTTACVEVMGLEDDCIELESMRALRDEYIKAKVTEGEKLVTNYYETAPKIIDEVNKCINANEIWRMLYNEQILPCVELVKEGNYEEAFKKYLEMTYLLNQKFLQ